MAFLRSVIKSSVHRKYSLVLDRLQNSTVANINASRIVLKSTAASSTLVQNQQEAIQKQPPKDPLDVSFEDAKAAFKSKTNLELIRAYVVYTLCSIDSLVTHNMKVSSKMSYIITKFNRFRGY